MSLKNNWKPKTNDDYVEAEDINAVADAVIELEKKTPSGGVTPDGTPIIIDDQMSPTSENPVQNKVVFAYVEEQNNQTKGLVAAAGQTAQQANQKAQETSKNLAEHTTSAEAHNDIRILVTELSKRLNALADSEDIELDQLSEIVDYIKDNKSLIDGITTSKVNVVDIIDNLTTNISNKPLSAKQGVGLKKLIDAIVVPTLLSQLGQDATHRLVTDAEKQTWNNKLGQTDLERATNEALLKAKESGEFDGVDGKSAYQYAQDGGYTGTEEEFAQKLAQENTDTSGGVTNVLWGKKVSLIGDSICAGADAEESYLGGYGKIIADRNNMTYQNLGKAGSTITAETYSSTTGGAKGWICRMVENMDADADYAIIEGGINDAWQWVDHKTITIGAITEGYNAELDDTTYYGAFESMLKKLVTKFQGKKIGYIAVPKMMGFYDSGRNVPNFYHIALECCAKWGVPVCDLNTIIPPTEYLKTLGTTYTADGTHPTYEGYVKYYCDPIEKWMKTLTTGGNNSATVARKAVEEYTKGFNDAIQALQKGKLDNTGISFKKARLPLADGTTIEIDVLTALDGTLVIPFINQVPISVTSPTDNSIFGSDYNGDGTNDGYLIGKRLSSSGAIKEQPGVTVTGYIPAKGGDVVRIYGCDWATTLNAHSYICAYDATGTFIGGYATVIGSTFSLTKYGTAISASHSVDENYNLTMTLANLANIAYIRVCSKGNTDINVPTFNSEDMVVTINEEVK